MRGFIAYSFWHPSNTLRLVFLLYLESLQYKQAFVMFTQQDSQDIPYRWDSAYTDAENTGN